MSNKNDFKAFSISNNANVVSQERYEESLSLYSGFPPDNIPTHLLNKVLRQSSTIASVVANFMSTQCGKDVLYPMDFKMHRDGKGENPREHR
ncbi:hypothetical protein [Photorhabdus noenieputensis]|uniref:hypothetical protein n=1 Tax=Photorhabdus noenieputensis TaxID=1208607 RepID=UPI0035E3DB81